MPYPHLSKSAFFAKFFIPMLRFIVPAIIILTALIVVIIVFIRHFPQAASIDLESLPAEQEAAMKAALMERRLKRKMSEYKKFFSPIFRGIAKYFTEMWASLNARVNQMEQKYRKKPHAMTVEQKQDVRQKIRLILEQAENLVDDEKFVDAEQKYIEVLSWDHQNLQAYFGLGQVYFARKEFVQAKETFQYLLRLIELQRSGDEMISAFSSLLTDSQINEIYYDYSVALQVEEQYVKAKEMIDKVVMRDAKNPKFLDKQVELCLLLEDKEAALDAFSRLKSVNPENQKLAGLEEKISAL